MYPEYQEEGDIGDDLPIETLDSQVENIVLQCKSLKSITLKVDDQEKMKKAIERFPNSQEENPHDQNGDYYSTESI